MSPHFLLKFKKIAKVIVYSEIHEDPTTTRKIPKYLYFQSSYLKTSFNSSSKSLVLIYKKEIDNQIKNIFWINFCSHILVIFNVENYKKKFLKLVKYSN
jgi:hypothetical protein